MSEEILMNVTPMECRIALLENGVIQEVYIERTRSRGIVGNIYIGKVIRVLPGMQSAFIDIGLERTAFIHANEIYQDKDNEGKTTNVPIQELIHEGQSLVVQVTKGPISSKGALLSTNISITARYLVFMPNAKHIGISLKIEDLEERNRLKTLITSCASTEEGEDRQDNGFIVRTAAEGVSGTEIQKDIVFLRRLWASIEENIKNVTSVPANVYEELPLELRVLRDFYNTKIERIRVDSLKPFNKLTNFATKLELGVENRITLHKGDQPIFDLFGIEDEIAKALEKKVPLKSGGYLIIEQTEAMTTIDVNTGAFVGSRNLEETIYKTNLEAAVSISRQLRLRNLGGIIIIDFIDMEDKEHQNQVLKILDKMLAEDPVKTFISQISDLGLVEMTRKRTRESLQNMLCEPCKCCHGKGKIKTAETVCYEIFREILRSAKTYNANKYMVLGSESVIDRLLDEESNTVADLEDVVNKPIKFQVEPIYHQEQFDVIPL